MSVIKIGAQVIRLNEQIPLPSYATEGSAAIDLYADIEHDHVLFAGENKKFGTGLKIWHNNPEYVGLLFPRSGGGSAGMNIKNTVGVIDSDYQGELIVNIWNNNEVGCLTVPSYKSGIAFAQLVFVRVGQAVFEEVKEFKAKTPRGAGGFGSTTPVFITGGMGEK